MKERDRVLESDTCLPNIYLDRPLDFVCTSMLWMFDRFLYMEVNCNIRVVLYFANFKRDKHTKSGLERFIGEGGLPLKF